MPERDDALARLRLMNAIPILMKLSARNQIPGKILALKKGPVSTIVTLQIAQGLKLTSVITADAAKDLKLAKGKNVVAIIKSSSIILGVE